MNAVKCLFKVEEIDKQGKIPLHTLLHDVSKSKYLIYAPSALSETSLFLTELVVDGTVNSFQDNSTVIQKTSLGMERSVIPHQESHFWRFDLT